MSTPYMPNDSSNNMLFYLRIHISNQQWKSEDLTPYGCESFVYICTWSNNIDISSRDSWSTELWNKCYMLYESYRPFDQENRMRFVFDSEMRWKHSSLGKICHNIGIWVFKWFFVLKFCVPIIKYYVKR